MREIITWFLTRIGFRVSWRFGGVDRVYKRRGKPLEIATNSQTEKLSKSATPECH